MIRIAIVGCGEHSRTSHAAPLARYAAQHTGELELVAACDLNADKAAEFCRSFGFKRSYTDLNEMLDKEIIDGCVSVMPIEQIVETASLLLERRIPCTIEKPLGTSVEDAERLSRTARDTGTPHMISVNRRFIPYLNQIRFWLKDVGPVQYARATQVRYLRDEPDFIWSTAIHALDALRYMGGEVKNFQFEIPSGPSAFWYLISLQFESGASGRIEVLPTSGMVEEAYEFFGEGFRARLTAGSGAQRSLECWHNGELVIEAKASDDEPEDLRNGAYQEVEEFVRALRTSTPPRPQVDDILPSARICFAIADSVQKKKVASE